MQGSRGAAQRRAVGVRAIVGIGRVRPRHVVGEYGGPRRKEIRRLQLAAERGRALGVLFRPLQAARESSHAALRIAIEPSTCGVRVNLLKSKGGVRGSVELDLTAEGS